MSSITKGRVKQIKPRQGGSFPASGIPIGTDGLLVDMISQLDLEEEIRLGGNHYVDISQTKTSTIIREWYFSESKGTTPIEEINDNIVTYTVIASIVNAVQTNIVENHINENIITAPDLDGDNFLVVREDVDSSVTMIILELYQGNFETKLHEKRIYLYEAPDGQIAVDEQVDVIDSINPFDDGQAEPENEGEGENEGNGDNDNENTGEQEGNEG